MLRRALFVTVLGAAACGSSPEQTVPEGSVSQISWSARRSADGPVDLLLALEVPRTEADRASIATIVGELVTRLQEGLAGDPRAREQWRAIDVVARVTAGAGVREVVWREEIASRAGASVFAQQLGEAALAVVGEAAAPSFEGLLGVVTTARARGGLREVVLVLAGDEPPSGPIAELLRSGTDQNVGIIVPRDGTEPDTCRAAKRPALEDWAFSHGVRVGAPCDVALDSIEPSPQSLCRGSVAIARDERGAPLCKVVVHLPAGASCERRRGHAPLGRDDEGRATCLVQPLAREEGGAICADAEQSCEGCGSGYCVPQQTDVCVRPRVRFTGGAWPGGSLVDITCNITR